MVRRVGANTGEARGEAVLSYIYDDVDNRLNPDQEECWHCGGEGETHDCIDGCCAGAEYGCDLCRRPCLECRLYAGRRAKAVREEVIKTGDVDVAIAWLKEIGRWHDGITRDRVEKEIVEAQAKLDASPSPTERDE